MRRYGSLINIDPSEKNDLLKDFILIENRQKWRFK